MMIDRRAKAIPKRRAPGPRSPAPSRAALCAACLCGTLLMVFFGVGCIRGSRPRNLLLITLDTMRADRLPPYGFSGVATPALDRLASEGVVFEQMFAGVPLTLPSHATMFTGLYPSRSGVRDNTGPALAAEFVTMSEVLRDRGLTTAAFVASSVLAEGRGLEQGFAYYSYGRPASCSGMRARRSANEVVDDTLSWLEGRNAAPFFVWTHLYDTHRPYGLPDEYMRGYADHYLAAIAFEDMQISRLIEYLENRDLLDDTLVVVVGDHGESLGDHGEESHGIFVYQEALHVPFVMRGRGIVSGRVSAVTRLIDVMPTVLALFGVAGPDVDGRNLAGLVTGTMPDPHLEVYAESLYPQRFGWGALRSLRADRYKVIDAPHPELYDLASDPREARNLFEDRRAVGTAMLNRLRDFDDREGPASTPPAVVDPAVAERISSLGYVSGSVDQGARAGSDRADPKERIDTFNRMTRLQWESAHRLPSRSSCEGIARP